MRNKAWMLAGALVLPFNAAMAADDEASVAGTGQPLWARWQGRLSLGVNSAPWRLGADTPLPRLSNATLMGDYYFGSALTGPSLLGGLRATGGLIFGSRSMSNTGQPSLATGDSFSVGSRSFGQTAAPYSVDPYGDTTTQPYFGFGYTGLAVRSGLSFSADLGLLARSMAGGAGRASLASQSLDDSIRQMRMTPMLQLGVSYAF